jgi:UDP-galactopyranose mutase
VHKNEFAYPVNTISKPEAVGKILSWAAGYGIVGAGRWGKWEHMNSDIVVDEALNSVSSFIKVGEWT